MRTLKANTIKRYGPCRDQLAIFEAEWPDGMPVTRKSFDRAAVLGIAVYDWEWFIYESFPEELSDMYDKDAAAFADEMACDVLNYTEYDAIVLEWVYYYLLGIRETQLEKPRINRRFEY